MFLLASYTISPGKKPSVLLSAASLLDATKVFNSVTLSVRVEIHLSNLSMVLPMLSSMSVSMTAFLMASFIPFFGQSLQQLAVVLD